MSKILIVGSVLKDVYLNIDTRREKLECGEGGVLWMDVGFNASEHYFFRRNSSFGGAAISLEVLEKMGIRAEISGAELKYGESGVEHGEIVGDYRYILVADEQMAYFSSSQRKKAQFLAPTEELMAIYVDRTAILDEKEVRKIEAYLEMFPRTRLAVHTKHLDDIRIRGLLKRADLVFLEERNLEFGAVKTVVLEEKALRYKGLKVEIDTRRIDLATHLSTYVVAATTILGGMLLGLGEEESLRMAKANVEHSTLDATLELAEMQRIVAEEKLG